MKYLNLSKYKYHRYFLHIALVIFFLFLVFVVNKFPKGTIIAQGDFFQVVSLKINHLNNLFTWFRLSGQGQYNPLIPTLPYYLFQWMLRIIGFSYVDIAETIMFLFLVISYFSMFTALGLLRPLMKIDSNSSRKWQFLGGFLYALNPVVFDMFSYSWGVNHQFLIYLFSPLIITIFIRLVVRKKRNEIAYFIVVFTVGTIGFNNLAFLDVLVISEFVLMIAFFIAGLIKDKKYAIKTAILLFSLELLLSLYVVVPFVSSEIYYVSNLSNNKNLWGNIFTLIKSTSPSIKQILTFSFDKYQFPIHDLLTPYLFPEIIFLFFLIPIVLAGIYKKNSSSEKRRIFLAFIFTWIIFVVFAARLSPPFAAGMSVLFKTLVFQLLRSPDKIISFYPFFLITLLYISLEILDLSRKLAIITAIAFLIIPFPFYMGGITKYLSYKSQSTPSRSGYKVAVTIPQAYINIARQLNKKKGGGSIISVPYNAITSVNWANYPRWNFEGQDPLVRLFKRPYISPDAPDHPSLEDKMSFENFDTKNGTPSAFLSLIKQFGGQYILYHKDIPTISKQLAAPTRRAIAQLVKKGILHQKTNNRYFTLYELSKTQVTPLISSPSKGVFQQISPVEYLVHLSHLMHKGKIEFKQSQSPEWKLFLLPFANNNCKSVFVFRGTANLKTNLHSRPIPSMSECSPHMNPSFATSFKTLFMKSIFSSSNSLVDNYANAWEISPSYIETHFSKKYYRKNPNGSISINLMIYYVPQSYFYLGSLLTLAIFSSSLTMLGYRGWRERKLFLKK